MPSVGGLVPLTYNLSKGFWLLLTEDPLLDQLLCVTLWMQRILKSVLWLTVLKKSEEIKPWNKYLYLLKKNRETSYFFSPSRLGTSQSKTQLQLLKIYHLTRTWNMWEDKNKMHCQNELKSSLPLLPRFDFFLFLMRERGSVYGMEKTEG